MLAATFLAIYFVPLFFVVIGKLAGRSKAVTLNSEGGAG
jgi:HAE1 family hydrophobic/amphiphilic exporter-1/multidrug efflux pump